MAYQVHNHGDDQEIKASYTSCGFETTKGRFEVTDVIADNQFVCLQGDLVDLEACLNNAAADEHVLEVERCIRTIKEKVHGIYNSLTFKKSDLHFN